MAVQKKGSEKAAQNQQGEHRIHPIGLAKGPKLINITAPQAWDLLLKSGDIGPVGGKISKKNGDAKSSQHCDGRIELVSVMVKGLALGHVHIEQRGCLIIHFLIQFSGKLHRSPFKQSL